MALLPQDPAAQKKALIGLIPVLLAIAYWFLLHDGYREELVEARSRLEQLESENARARIEAARGGEELERRAAAYERHITRLEQLIPTSEEVAGLLHTISLRAQETGVEIERVTPQGTHAEEHYEKRSY